MPNSSEREWNDERQLKGAPADAASPSQRLRGRRGSGDADRKGRGRLDLGRMKRAIRKAERRAGDGSEIGGTGATILKFRGSPVARLADKRRIGTEELRAADDITIAFHAQAGALMIKPPSLEKRDATYHSREPAIVIDAVSRYKRWARHWSARARDGDRMLEIVIAAVIDERAFHAIEADVGIRHGLAAKAVIAALRDYAARAGWTDRRTADAWIAAAEAVFARRDAAKA
jgi:hypothetical protein